MLQHLIALLTEIGGPVKLLAVSPSTAIAVGATAAGQAAAWYDGATVGQVALAITGLGGAAIGVAVFAIKQLGAANVSRLKEYEAAMAGTLQRQLSDVKDDLAERTQQVASLKYELDLAQKDREGLRLEMARQYEELRHIRHDLANHKQTTNLRATVIEQKAAIAEHKAEIATQKGDSIELKVDTVRKAL
jgi:hypothetical protein